MNKQLFGLLFCLITITGCSYQSAKFLTKTAYSGKAKLKSVYVIMVSDKNTKDCLHYCQLFLVDSLKKNYNLNADGIFYCCRDKNSDMNAIINSSLPFDKEFQTILTIVITKTVIGHGTSSKRELQLNLFDTGTKEELWNGTLSTSFDWFISDENYRAVATKITSASLLELRNRGVL